MTKGVFITGTDTGVGKTYVAELIASLLRNRGVNVGVMKPAETGCRVRSGRLIPEDAVRLMQAAGVEDNLDFVNPYRFRQPVAPGVAADAGRTKIDIRVILKKFRLLSNKHEFMIVEGAGGILVPLSSDYTYLDLAQALQLPVVIVARPGLGTINHTLLTVSALQQRKIPITGIIINHAVKERVNLALRTNPEVIARMSLVRLLGTVRHGEKKISWIKDAIKVFPRLRAGE